MWRGRMIHEGIQRSSYLRRRNDYAIERSANRGLKGNSQGVVGLRQIGIDGDGLSAAGGGVIRPPQLEQGHAQVVVGLGETGVKSYRLLVMGNSSHKIPPLGQLDGEAIMHSE